MVLQSGRGCGQGVAMIVNAGCFRREGTRFTINADQDLSRTQVDLVTSVLDRHGVGIDRAMAVEINEAETIVEWLSWNDEGQPFIVVVDGEYVVATTRNVIPNGGRALHAD